MFVLWNNCARDFIHLEDKDFKVTTQTDCILIGNFTVQNWRRASYRCLANLVTYTPTQFCVLLWNTDGSCYPQIECLRPVWLNRLTCGPNFCNNNYKVPAGFMLQYLCSTQLTLKRQVLTLTLRCLNLQVGLYIYKWHFV